MILLMALFMFALFCLGVFCIVAIGTARLIFKIFAAVPLVVVLLLILAILF